jgi:parallel beta-helix repeat protein
LWLVLSPPTEAALFTVINTDDSGPGSLRQALLDANNNPGADTIHFNIPGPGPHTITPESDLPILTGPVTIDGYTQAGAGPSTSLNGNNAVLTIEVDGNNAGMGLVLAGGNSTVRGLCLNRFCGIILSLESDGNTIEGNLIGTDLTGMMTFDVSASGVVISGANNQIGGTAPAARNVISGTLAYGVSIEGAGATGNQVQGNFIGTDLTGTAGLPNSLDGVFIDQDAANNTIGGIDLGLSPGNVIAFNGRSGVYVASGTGNRILGNHIFNNGGLGIDLGPSGVTANDPADADTGANGLQNFPILGSAMTSGDSVMIDLSFNSKPNTLYRLEFFVSTESDPSGYGEGMNLGAPFFVRTDANGDYSILVSLPFTAPSGGCISATATDPLGNTSEFSPCVPVSGPGSFRFSASRYSVHENGGSVLITVVRTNGANGAVSVNYTTRDGTATAGADYVTASGTLMFADGETNMTFTVPILDDTLSDGNESVVLLLSDPSGGAALTEPAAAVVTILDDEPLPILKITLADTNVVVSWPTNAPGFILHAAATMSAAAWSALTNQVKVDGDQNTVTFPAAGLSKFYRLAKDEEVSPRLTLGRDGSDLVISWPLTVVGFVLQSRDSLAPAGQWETISDTLPTIGEERSVRVDPAGGMKFYRLIRP